MRSNYRTLQQLADISYSPLLSLSLYVVSFGGRMAHLMACAAKEIGFAPRALIVLDPAPPVADFPHKIRLSRPSTRESAAAFLSLQLATIARMTDRDDTLEELYFREPPQTLFQPSTDPVCASTDPVCATMDPD